MTWDGNERRKLNTDDHDLLIRIDEKLTKALFELNILDKRVRTLENGYWKVVGCVGTAVVIGDIVIKWLLK